MSRANTRRRAAALPRPLPRRPLPSLALSCLVLAAAGCTSAATPAEHGHSPQRSALAAGYMAIARPANEQLDVEVDGYEDNRGSNLVAAEAALRAQATTERHFDRQLLQITFPARIEAIARSLVTANERRAKLTDLQALAASRTELTSLDSAHNAANAAVEVWVRMIRRALGLPPPSES